MTKRLMGLVGATMVFCGCAAADHDIAQKRDDAPALIGSYATRNGGTLEIFEPEPGQFIIGELSFDESDRAALPAESTNGAATSQTLSTLYERMVGGVVPPELRAADARRKAAQPATSRERALAPSYASVPQPFVPPEQERFDKEADRNVAEFRANSCRLSNRWASSDGCQSFNYCHTEATNDTTIVEDGLFGAYSVVRPYRGNVTMEVLYNDVLSFSRTISEGGRYRAWKSLDATSAASMVSSKLTKGGGFKLETRVRYADGNGYHVAVLGTRERRYWSAYNDSANQNDTFGCSSVPTDGSQAGPAIVGR